MPADVHANVAQVWVTLKGQVDWEYQRTAAKDAVSFMAGVRGVTNDITLKPAAPEGERGEFLEILQLVRARIRHLGCGEMQHGELLEILQLLQVRIRQLHPLVRRGFFTSIDFAPQLLPSWHVSCLFLRVSCGTHS